MLIADKSTKKLNIYILHSGIEIIDKETGFKFFFVFYSLNKAKRKFKEQLQIELKRKKDLYNKIY